MRTSLLAAIVGVHAFQGTAWTVAGKVGHAQGNHHPSIAPYGLFHCADGSVQVACANESLWRRLCAEFGLDPETPGMTTNGERVEHRDEVIALLERAFADIPAEDLLARLDEGRHPGGQGAHHRRGLRLGPDAVAGPARRRRARHRSAGCRCPARRCGSSTPGPDGETETTRRDHTAPPVLGADGDAIRAWLRATASRSPTATTSRTGTPHEHDPPARLDARALRDLVLDPGSWQSWDSPVPRARRRRRRTPASWRPRRRRPGRTSRSSPARALLRGRRVAVVAGEFGFLAGSIGVAAAERLIAAVERATEEGLPLLAAPVSGGTRMQEGTVAFLQMIGITAAIARHKEAGLPYLVYLRNPTFGGVLASWGSLGHVTIAEPGASIGFLGPRVYEALYGEQFPEGVQTAEHLAERGLIDAVVPHEEVGDVADRALRVLAARQTWHLDVARRRAADPGGRHRRRRPRGRPQRLGRRHRVPAAPTGPGVRRLLRTAATDVVGPVRHRRRREGPGAAAGAGPLRRRAVRRARPGPARPVAVGTARPGGAARGPARHAPGRRSCGCRWSRSSTPPGRRCPGRPRRAGWPARSPAACTTW